jgi:hypothetical protein
MTIVLEIMPEMKPTHFQWERYLKEQEVTMQPAQLVQLD